LFYDSFCFHQNTLALEKTFEQVIFLGLPKLSIPSPQGTFNKVRCPADAKRESSTSTSSGAVVMVNFSISWLSPLLLIALCAIYIAGLLSELPQENSASLVRIY
jgi:hypothetical protein